MTTPDPASPGAPGAGADVPPVPPAPTGTGPAGTPEAPGAAPPPAGTPPPPGYGATPGGYGAAPPPGGAPGVAGPKPPGGAAPPDYGAAPPQGPAPSWSSSTSWPEHREPRPAGLVLGIILIVVGALFLALRLADLQLGPNAWPLWLIVPGLAMVAASLIVPSRGGLGLAIPGIIIAGLGVILWVQVENLDQALPYTAVGLGLLLVVLAFVDGGRSDQRRAERRAARDRRRAERAAR